MTDPAEILRRAADEMEQTAEKATQPGRWTVEEDADTWELYAGRGEFHGLKIAKCKKRGQAYAEYWPNEADSAYIALVDPIVGKAWVATFRAAAEAFETWNPPPEHLSDDTLLMRTLSAARALLREAGDDA